MEWGGPHVDDFICTGKGEKFESCLKKMKEAVTWGSWKVNTFTHCGRNISRDKDMSVLVEQHVYVDKLRPIILESNRVGTPLSQKEVDQTRTLLGGLGWAAKQTRPDACYGVSVLLSEINTKEREVAKRANKLLERVQREKVTLRFPSSLDMDKAMLVVFTDASCANRRDGHSQGGVIYALMSPASLKGARTHLFPRMGITPCETRM